MTVTDTRTLIEALPYIREFRGEVFVIRCQPRLDEDELHEFAKDVAMLRFVGVRVVVVHPHEASPADEQGGRPSATHRLVHAIGKNTQATGVSGADGAPRCLVSVDDENAVSVDADLIRHVIDDYTPVIESVAVDAHGHASPADPDQVAALLASALRAHKVIFLVDERLRVLGEGAEISEMRLTADVIERLALDGPFAETFAAARSAVDSGVVRYSHLIPTDTPHALLLEMFTDAGYGSKLRSAADWEVAAATKPDEFPAVGYFCWE